AGAGRRGRSNLTMPGAYSAQRRSRAISVEQAGGETTRLLPCHESLLGNEGKGAGWYQGGISRVSCGDPRRGEQQRHVDLNQEGTLIVGHQRVGLPIIGRH